MCTSRRGRPGVMLCALSIATTTWWGCAPTVSEPGNPNDPNGQGANVLSPNSTNGSFGDYLTGLAGFDSTDPPLDANSISPQTEFIIDVEPDSSVTLSGVLDSSGQIDRYSLGLVDPGDQFLIDVTANGFLDGILAIADEDLNIIAINDDRNYLTRDLDPLINTVLPNAINDLQVLVASSPGSSSKGAYEMKITRVSESYAPDPAFQTVLLNFNGATGVNLASRRNLTIPVFSAGRIDLSLEYATEELIDTIVRHVRADYEGYNVEIISSRDGVLPVGDYSTIHFGTYDPALLGIAESVDTFNRKPSQVAIVFTDTFDVFMALDPTLEQLGCAMANVTSHELGHLLGLRHVRDVHALMDITANLRQMTVDQYFVHSPVHEDEFPIGFQNAPNLLMQAVGGDPVVIAQAAQRAKQALKSTHSISEGLEDLPRRGPFSTCFCPSCMKKRAQLAAKHKGAFQWERL